MTGGLIRCVDGDVKPGVLGHCHCHEHLFIADGKSSQVVPSTLIDDENKSLQELCLYRDAGGSALVDAQPVGCGRSAAVLERIAKESGIHIIASTGFHKLDFYEKDHFVYTASQGELEELFSCELTKGMYTGRLYGPELPREQGTARAGIIKAASDGRDIRRGEDDLPVVRKLFSAAGAAAKRTGAPVITHLEMGKGADSQLEVLASQGIGPERVILSHLDRVVTPEKRDYDFAVAKSGAWLQLDTIGRFRYHSDEDEVDFIAWLCDKGFENQILLGMDTTNQRMKSYGAELGLDYIITRFRPLLESRGIGPDLFHKFTVNNPQRALCFERRFL